MRGSPRCLIRHVSQIGQEIIERAKVMPSRASEIKIEPRLTSMKFNHLKSSEFKCGEFRTLLLMKCCMDLSTFPFCLVKRSESIRCRCRSGSCLETDEHFNFIPLGLRSRSV